MSRLISRNVISNAGRTTMRLEPELWDALHEVARCEGKDLHTLIREIDARARVGERTSAVRVYVLEHFRAAASAA